MLDARQPRSPGGRSNSKVRTILTAATAFVAATALIGGSPSAVSPAAATEAHNCLTSGTDASLNASLAAAGPGVRVALCPGAVFDLAHSVKFTAPGQVIYTDGRPTGIGRAVLKIASSSLTTAIDGNSQDSISVENVEVDGNRPTLGFENGGALLEMGAGGSHQTVEDVYAHDTRSWSTLHFIEGKVTNSIPACQDGRIVNNEIGPAGNPGLPGVTSGWADGISLACGHTLVKGNRVTDATDGGIVVFGAPGSTIEGNTVTAATRQLFGGINMVDYAPMSGNYTGTVVTHNTIDAQGAMVKIGIAMGQQVWNCLPGTNYGATVTDNVLKGAHMGYGYPVNGVRDWTVAGNVDDSTHVGTQTAGGCFGSPPASQPAGFQVERASDSTLQRQYQPAVLTNILGTLIGPNS